MTNLMRCLGAYAEHPYEWEKLDLRVYSIEELCFAVVRNRYLLGMDSFRADLVDWIEQECALPELAGILRRKRETMDAAQFAAALLEYVRYNTPEEIKETVQVLAAGSDMDIYEKSLARADFLIESGKYHQAYDAYEDLRRTEAAKDKELQARILYNEGVMNARMFFFARAAECFRASYELTHDPDAYLRYLAALRMRMTEQEYLDYITEDAKGYQFSMSLEGDIREAERAYETSREHAQVKRLFQLRHEGKSGEYYAYAREIIEELKLKYRGSDDAAAKI